MIYCDPPYIGRHAGYYNGFTNNDGNELVRTLIGMPANFALSMWLENRYRRNTYVDHWFSCFPQYTMSHFSPLLTVRAVEAGRVGAAMQGE